MFQPFGVFSLILENDIYDLNIQACKFVIFEYLYQVICLKVPHHSISIFLVFLELLCILYDFDPLRWS